MFGLILDLQVASFYFLYSSNNMLNTEHILDHLLRYTDNLNLSKNVEDIVVFLT